MMRKDNILTSLLMCTCKKIQNTQLQTNVTHTLEQKLPLVIHFTCIYFIMYPVCFGMLRAL